MPTPVEPGAGSSSHEASGAPPTETWRSIFRRMVFGDLSKDVRGVERALSSIRGFTTIGFVLAAAYGLAAGNLHGALMAVLAAGAAFAVGCILGFLFGLPRWEGTTVQHTAPRQGAAPTDKTEPAERQEAKPAAITANRLIAPNTNLDRVTDWLTTLIVGLGLVHWKGAYQRATDASVWLTNAIHGCASGDCLVTAGNGSPGAAILLSFAISGFLLVYLWAQRYMGSEMRRAYNEAQYLREELDEKTREKEAVDEKLKATDEKLTEKKAQENKMAELAATGKVGAVAAQAAVQPAGLQQERYRLRDLQAVASKYGLDEPLVADIRERYRRKRGYWDEPLAGFGPESTAALQISAVVEQMEGMPYYRVVITVTARTGGLAGPVVFFLHHTLSESVRVATSNGRSASIEVHCAGTFIVGAFIPEQRVRLSLDLSNAEGATREFREN